MITNEQGQMTYTYEELNMSDNIKIYDDHRNEIEMDNFQFSGGEEHVRIKVLRYYKNVNIHARLKSSRDVMRLLLINDAIRRSTVSNVYCSISYMPYSRQDRVCNEGEALSIKVMTDLINSCKFDLVSVYDVHSDVTTALLDRCISFSQSDIFNDNFKELLYGTEYIVISPDAGATKKAIKVAKDYGLRMVEASKVRDTMTGNIVSTNVNGDVNGKDCFIIDDICDGGRTFIELAKVLKAKGAKSVVLYVTHGIFSKGLEPLKEHIDHVYTTDTFCDLKSNEFLTVKEMEL